MSEPTDRRKLSRSRTSCLKCRARKARCGGEPPNSCDYCSKRGLSCVWPKEDRRTSRFLPREAEPSFSAALQPWSILSDTPLDAPSIDLDQSWRNWLTTPGQSPSTSQTLGVDCNTDAFLQSLLGDQSNLQVQLLVEGSTPPKDWRRNKTGIMRIKYRRPHGRTAFVPGNLAVPIRVVLKGKEPMAPQTDSSILTHLVDVFQTHIHPQFPGIDCDELRESISHPTPSFLLNCVATVTARFSTDPRVALPSLKPEAYGDVYYNQANAMLGDVMKIPLRETVMGFVLLACSADSVSGQWMMTGNATRMAMDLGLQSIDPPDVDPETQRLNRLCFWSVLTLDYMSSLGVGRPTSLRPESITQPLPSDEDMRSTTSPFPFAVGMLHASGPLINVLNTDSSQPEFVRLERSSIMRRYQELPLAMQWSTTNLRLHNAVGQGAMFFHLHVWVHTILSTSQSDESSRSGAKLIGEYLALCDVVNPAIYYTQPFLGQPLFTAATTIMSELRRQLDGTDHDSTAFLSSIAQTQIDTIKRAIRATSVYWRGALLVETAIDECIRTDTERDKIWVENESYAVEVYDWSLPDRYRADGAQIN